MGGIWSGVKEMGLKSLMGQNMPASTGSTSRLVFFAYEHAGVV
jgi:hypothetical protein